MRDPEAGGVFRAPRVECSSGVLQAEEQFAEEGMTHDGERSWFKEVLPAGGSYSQRFAGALAICGLESPRAVGEARLIKIFFEVQAAKSLTETP
jgi:hypothetical protein